MVGSDDSASGLATRPGALAALPGLGGWSPEAWKKYRISAFLLCRFFVYILKTVFASRFLFGGDKMFPKWKNIYIIKYLSNVCLYSVITLLEDQSVYVYNCCIQAILLYSWTVNHHFLLLSVPTLFWLGATKRGADSTPNLAFHVFKAAESIQKLEMTGNINKKFIPNGGFSNELVIKNIPWQ